MLSKVLWRSHDLCRKMMRFSDKSHTRWPDRRGAVVPQFHLQFHDSHDLVHNGTHGVVPAFHIVPCDAAKHLKDRQKASKDAWQADQRIGGVQFPRFAWSQ